MPRKYTAPLDDLTVKAKDCYDPKDYVMVHKDYLARLQALQRRDAAGAVHQQEPQRFDINEFGVVMPSPVGDYVLYEDVLANFSSKEQTMTEKAPEVTLVCACGSRAFYATPDGADSYILQCSACGCHSEISAGRGMTLSLIEVADAPAEPSGKG